MNTQANTDDKAIQQEQIEIVARLFHKNPAHARVGQEERRKSSIVVVIARLLVCMWPAMACPSTAGYLLRKPFLVPDNDSP